MSFQRHSRADRNRLARSEQPRITRWHPDKRRWWWQSSEINRARYETGEMVRRDNLASGRPRGAA